MKHIEVHVRERDKGLRRLSLLNLRDEVVNFLYKDTVASSTKSDLHFFVLVFFASVPAGNVSLLEKILDEAIPKLNRLNRHLASKKTYLQRSEYRVLVEEYGLSALFERDIFFVISEAILDFDQIEPRFQAFYQENEALARVIQEIKRNYAPELRASFAVFESSRIQDDRYDDDGTYHDLSKSVYRTIRMRNSRNLDLNLQKYTTVKSITSQSPVDLIFFQHVEPQIVFDLWDKYQVANYMKSLWDHASGNVVVQGLTINFLWHLIEKYVKWKRINGATHRKEKQAAKQEFEISRNQHGKVLDDLTMRLVDSVLESNKRLQKEIRFLQRQLSEQQSKSAAAQDKDEIKKLKERIARLENLSIEAKVVESRPRRQSHNNQE
jgi:hypothetical protein